MAHGLRAFPVPPQHVPAWRREPMLAARAAPASLCRVPASPRHLCQQRAPVLVLRQRICGGGRPPRWGWPPGFAAGVIRATTPSVRCGQSVRPSQRQRVACSLGTGVSRGLRLPRRGLERRLLLLRRALPSTGRSERCWRALNNFSRLKIP